MNKRPTLKKLNALVSIFNAANPVGSTVIYREIMPDGDDPGSEPQELTVRTPAYVHQGHTAAVFLNGKSGFVDTSHCTTPARNE